MRRIFVRLPFSIENTSLKPNEETLVYLAYKNLAFDGYHTKSINHTSLLMLDEYSSLPEEFLAYKINANFTL